MTINSNKLVRFFLFFLVYFSYNSSVLAAAYVSDLDISLSHNSVSVQLFAGDEDDNDGDIDTVFDDESSNPSVGTPPFSSDMQSFGLLSNFDGNNLNGLWELQILDDFESDEGNILISWNIFGTIVGGGTFDIAGPSAIDVDTDPATIVSLSVLGLGVIEDINVGVSISEPLASVPVPAAVWLFGSGFIGLIGMRKKPKLPLR